MEAFGFVREPSFGDVLDVTRRGIADGVAEFGVAAGELRAESFEQAE